MNKQNIKEVQNKMLSDEQADAVKKMIVKSMRESYINIGTLPDAGFESAALKIADGVVHDVQMALMESNVFKKIIEKSSIIKHKPVKMGTTKIKKYARK